MTDTVLITIEPVVFFHEINNLSSGTCWLCNFCQMAQDYQNAYVRLLHGTRLVRTFVGLPLLPVSHLQFETLQITSDEGHNIFLHLFITAMVKRTLYLNR